MEGLFNLLLESPLLLFFVIAAVISLFQGMGGSKEEQSQSGRDRTQQKRRPSRSGPAPQQEDQVDWKDIFRQEERQERPTKPQPTVRRDTGDERKQTTVTSLPTDAEKELSKSSRDWHEKYEQIRERKREAVEKAGEITDSPIMKGDLTKASHPNLDLDFKNMSKNDAVKGVVWAEVLGKPKARRRK